MSVVNQLSGDYLSTIYEANGPIQELELDEALQLHLEERGITEKHIVTFDEIREVLTGAPRFFENPPGRRAPLVMVGPTSAGRMLCVPIEPTGQRGKWRPVTAFTANTHHVQRYVLENENERQRQI